MNLRTLITVLLVPVLFSCDSKNSPAPTEAASFDESRGGNQGSGSRFQAIGDARTVRDPENPPTSWSEPYSTGLTLSG